MARKSADALAAPAMVTVETRPNPPEVLTAEEAAIWCAVVDTKPAAWFDPASAPVLVEYCRAVIEVGVLAEMVREARGGKAYTSLLKARNVEAMRVASLATKLRLTQQSRYTPNVAGTLGKKAGQPKPWLASVS